jgi:hypothetical protein
VECFSYYYKLRVREINEPIEIAVMYQIHRPWVTSLQVIHPGRETSKMEMSFGISSSANFEQFVRVGDFFVPLTKSLRSERISDL